MIRNCERCETAYTPGISGDDELCESCINREIMATNNAQEMAKFKALAATYKWSPLKKEQN